MTICGLLATKKGDTVAESISISNVIENNPAIVCTAILPISFDHKLTSIAQHSQLLSDLYSALSLITVFHQPIYPHF